MKNSLSVFINGLKGKVTFKILDTVNQVEIKKHEMSWSRLNDEVCGFITTFVDEFIEIDMISAEQFINLILKCICKKFKISEDNVRIFNHISEELDSVQFLPPDFEGNEADMLEFISMQDALERAIIMFYDAGLYFTDNIIAHCISSEILPSFLMISQFNVSNFNF